MRQEVDLSSLQVLQLLLQDTQEEVDSLKKFPWEQLLQLALFANVPFPQLLHKDWSVAVQLEHYIIG